MKRALIITSAGCSTRFSQSVGRDVYKILYHEGPETDCLLAWQLELARENRFDHVVIVGGYAFEDLCAYLQRHHGGEQWIETVYNGHFRDRGTCYSFVCGLEALRGRDLDEIVFMEGDLMLDAASFSAVVAADRDIVTATQELIRADKSVVFYQTADGHLRYVYDPRHRALQIDGPVVVLGNSGQVWKFRDVGLLRKTTAALGAAAHDDSNLAPIMAYFNARGLAHVDFITFKDWFNCNTVEDYCRVRRYRGQLHA